MLFPHSPKGCEKRKHGKRCAALPHEISPAHSARVKQSVFLWHYLLLRSPSPRSVPCVQERLASENIVPESLVSGACVLKALCGVRAQTLLTITQHSGGKERKPMPRVVLTVTWVQSYSVALFSGILAVRSAYKKVIFNYQKHYKLIVSRL